MRLAEAEKYMAPCSLTDGEEGVLESKTFKTCLRRAAESLRNERRTGYNNTVGMRYMKDDARYFVWGGASTALSSRTARAKNPGLCMFLARLTTGSLCTTARNHARYAKTVPGAFPSAECPCCKIPGTREGTSTSLPNATRLNWCS